MENTKPNLKDEVVGNSSLFGVSQNVRKIDLGQGKGEVLHSKPALGASGTISTNPPPRPPPKSIKSENWLKEDVVAQTNIRKLSIYQDWDDWSGAVDAMWNCDSRMEGSIYTLP